MFDSIELAFRNQFFTPRYVVEFLTNNTLGRIWYEMRKGDAKLKDQCRYMVRRPNEIFLGPQLNTNEDGPDSGQNRHPDSAIPANPCSILSSVFDPCSSVANNSAFLLLSRKTRTTSIREQKSQQSDYT